MAKTRVEMVLSASDSEAIRAASKLLDKIRESGKALDDVGKRAKDAGSGVESFLTGTAGKLAGILALPATAFAAINAALDLANAKAAAFTREMEKGGAASRSYAEAFGKVVANIPGIKPDEARQIDQLLKGTAGRFALGEGGLTKLADAYAQIQSAIPLAPQAAKAGALTETAQLLSLSPTDNAAGIGLGIAKITEASGYTYSANQAQNLLRMQQTLGLVKEVGPVGQSIPKLGAAAKMGGVGLADMQAFMAWMTQATGDTEGSESTTAIQAITANLMTRAGDVEKAIGVRPEGDVFNRIRQLQQSYQSGAISEDTLGELFPVVTRGATGKMALNRLLGAGLGEVDEYRRMMNAPEVRQGDFTAQDIETVGATIPGARYAAVSRQLQSRGEARRAGDEEAARETLYRETIKKRFEKSRYTDDAISDAMRFYDRMRSRGASLEASAGDAELVARTSIGGFRKLLGMAPGTLGTSADPAKDDEFFAKMTQAVANGVGKVPRRNLESGLEQ